MRAGVLGAAALVAWRPASAAEEWRIANAEPVSGAWRVAEVKFFSDHACSKKLNVVHGSAYTSHVPAHRPLTPPEPLQHAGEDCWGRCGERESGVCGWCGAGNACCRSGFPLDPPECHHAVGRGNRSQHQCVALSPPGRLLAQLDGVSEAFDKNLQTAFEAKCERHVCPPGSLILGISVSQPSAVQCVLVIEPAPEDGEAQGRKLWLSRGRRPAHLCPGRCRSGVNLEGGGHGVCTKFMSHHHQCGDGPIHKAGVACGGCRGLVNTWEAVPMTPTVTPLHGSVGRKFTFTMLKALGSAPALAPSLRGAPAPAPGPAAPPRWLRVAPAPAAQGAEDCWVPCQGRGGFCSFCGAGRACCRPGFPGDPAECGRGVGFVKPLQHQCVSIPAEHVGSECLPHCGGRAGACGWCGAGGLCCRQGDGGDPAECRGALGFLTHGRQHECVHAPVPHEGEDCWGECGGRSGSCDWCGAGNACCRAGADVRLPHSDGSASLDAAECRLATGFTSVKYHQCVRLAHLENNGSAAIGPDGTSEGIVSGAAYDVLDAEREAEGEVEVIRESSPRSPVLAAAEARQPGADSALRWAAACALSAILGSALTGACVLLCGAGWPRAEATPPPSPGVGSAEPALLPPPRRQLLRCATKEFGGLERLRGGDCGDEKTKLF